MYSEMINKTAAYGVFYMNRLVLIGKTAIEGCLFLNVVYLKLVICICTNRICFVFYKRLQQIIQREVQSFMYSIYQN